MKSAEAKARRFGRVGLVGDIHAEDVLLERALDFLSARHVEMICATGDVPDGCGSVDRCCRLLEEREVVVVRGNHDRWLLTGAARDLPDATSLHAVAIETRRLLEKLPPVIEFDTTHGRAMLCHGLGANDMARVGPDDFGYALEANEDLQTLVRRRYHRWILNGHSHRRMVRHFPGLTIVNAGTLKRDHAPGFLEIDFKAGVVLAYEFDARWRIVDRPTELPLFEREVTSSRRAL